jgi:hypothetical protein
LKFQTSVNFVLEKLEKLSFRCWEQMLAQPHVLHVLHVLIMRLCSQMLAQRHETMCVMNFVIAEETPPLSQGVNSYTIDSAVRSNRTQTLTYLPQKSKDV